MTKDSLMFFGAAIRERRLTATLPEVGSFVPIHTQGLFVLDRKVRSGSEAVILPQKARPAGMRGKAVARFSSWRTSAVGHEQSPLNIHDSLEDTNRFRLTPDSAALSASAR